MEFDELTKSSFKILEILKSNNNILIFINCTYFKQ